jgi:hypothetical protein
LGTPLQLGVPKISAPQLGICVDASLGRTLYTPQAFYLPNLQKPYLHYSQADGDKGQALGRYINYEFFFSCQQVLVYFRNFNCFLDITHWLTGYFGQFKKKNYLEKHT